MKKYLYLLILGMFPFFVQAQKMTADEKAEAEKNGQVVEEGENETASLLYQVSRDGDQPFYLFGTIHLIGEEEFEFPENYREVFESCEKLVMELDMNDPKLQTSLMSHLTAKDGETLDKLLSKADYEKANAFFSKKTKMDLKLFNNLKPFYLNSLLYPSMIDGNTKSYEVYLMDLAKETGKEVQGLETAEFQVEIFDKIPAKEQAKMFMDIVNDFEKNKKILADLIKFYKHRDPEVLYQYMINNMESYKKYQEVLLDSRNETWIHEINSFTQEGICFFAVGAGHLGGEMGLLNLLKQEGFKLTAIE